MQPLLTREWLITNGLGGYASGTVAGVATRRYHGLLVAALPAPHGRTMFFNHVIHHRAQLGVYLRLNDQPVPPLYGPSADDRMGF